MKKNSSKAAISAVKLQHLFLFFGVSALGFCYFHLLNPTFSYQWQMPVFFFDGQFFQTFYTHPGGLLEYVSAFLTNFYAVHWLGALLLTLILALVMMSTRRFLRLLNPALAVPILYIIPALLVLSMASLYAQPISVLLAFLITLAAANGFIAFADQRASLRTAVAVSAMILLYYLVSAPFFLFVLLVTLHELIKKKNLLILLLLPLSVLMVMLADRFIFAANPGYAFLHLLPFQLKYRLLFAPYFLYAFFPLVLILNFALRKQQDRRFFHAPVAWIGQIVLVAVMSAAAVFFSYDKTTHNMMQVEYFASQRQWGKLLTFVRAHPVNHRLVLFQTYRALYHQGKLLNEMFYYPFQIRAFETLMMTKEFAFSAMMENSDFLMDMGHVNEAEHWAHEALAHFGEAPEILIRMFQVNYLKENYPFAEMCLLKLAKNPFYRHESARLMALLKNPKAADPYLAGVRKVMFREDFPQFTYRFRENLELMQKHNPMNRMVFEYLTAYNLFSGNLPKLFAHIDDFKALGYTKLPQHVEEAALLYLLASRAEKPVIGDYTISPATIKRFADYNRILAKYNADTAAANRELFTKYSNTYWFYHMYTRMKLIKEKEQQSAEELS
jgi:hypothetical protein